VQSVLDPVYWIKYTGSISGNGEIAYSCCGMWDVSYTCCCCFYDCSM